MKDRKYYCLFLVALTIFFYFAYFININQNQGYNLFKNIHFGDKLNVVVAPHGIYTYKYLNFENLRECYTEEIFRNTAKNLNVTIYWEGNNGRLFWFWFTNETTGLFYYVPIKWF